VKASQSFNNTQKSSRKSANEKLVDILERRVSELEKANAKLLRLVEMVMEERYYRPVVTGGVRENVQEPMLPIESLNDVATFDEDVDRAEVQQQDEKLSKLERELNEIEAEHRDWRAEKGLTDETTAEAVPV
jgi:polyhydroxyalkanoate synthesis regulator phasin